MKMKKPIVAAIVVALAVALALPLAAPAGASPASMTVVSDTSTDVTSGNVLPAPTYPYAAVLAWEPGPNYPNDGPDDSGWESNSLWDKALTWKGAPYSFSVGADWIWESYRVVNSGAGDVVDFSKTFTIPGIPTAGTLYITCDNGYEVSLNSGFVGSAQLGAGWRTSNLTEPFVNTSGWQSVESYDVTSWLQNGLNTLVIGCANEELTNASQSKNPGGLIFQIDIEYEEDGDVPVDIKPTSCPNPLNVKSKGVLPVAILGTAGFDVTQVDPATVELEGVSPLRWALEDVATPFVPFTGKVDCLDCTTDGPDGFMDLTLKFDKQAVVAALGEVSDGDCLVLKLTGELNDGTTIEGQDVVRIIKKGRR